MIHNINLTPIFQALVTLFAALITYFVVPWIKAHTTEAQQRTMRMFVKAMVFAAEQIYGEGHGSEKLKYVEDRLREAGYTVDTSEIEAAVAEYLNYALSQTQEITLYQDAEEETTEE